MSQDAIDAAEAREVGSAAARAGRSESGERTRMVRGVEVPVGDFRLTEAQIEEANAMLARHQAYRDGNPLAE